MLAAIQLDQLIKKLPKITASDLTALYKLTYKEAYGEGKKDAQITCGCQEED